MAEPSTAVPARWERPGRGWRWGLPAASLAWAGLLMSTTLIRTPDVSLASGLWRAPLLALAVAVAAAGVLYTGVVATRPTVGRHEHKRLLRLQLDQVRRGQVEPDLRTRSEQRERPVNPTTAVLASSSAGAAELVHAAMVVPTVAMLWARAALDTSGWLAGALVLAGLLVAASAAYWIRRTHLVFRGVARLDVPALVAR